jgi:argininosuccinate lyase
MLKQDSANYRGYRTPGIRLTEEILPHLGKLYGERTAGMYPALHAFDKAHTVMLIEEGLLDRSAGIAILQGFRQMEAEGVAAARSRVGGALHSGEQYMIRLLGEEIGGRFHLARSSGDLAAVGLNTMQREKLLELMRALNRFRRVLLGLAAERADIIMPGYSFGHHAQPMTLAHLLLSWAATLERDFDRLLGVFRRINVSPAGAAIMVGSDFPVNRARTAELLGFDAVHENCADAIVALNADDLLDMPAAIAILYHSLAKWAEDIVLWTSNEYHFIDVPDRYCGTSSIMMQKKTVIGPAEVKGASSEALGCFVMAYHALKGSTGLPINERSNAMAALWRVVEYGVRDMDMLCDLLPVIHFRKEFLLEHSKRHWATATDLAGELVRQRDVPWRSAHQIVGILVRLCEERDLTPSDVTPALLDEAALLYHGQPAGLDQAAIDLALDPEHFVARRDLQGGPAPSETARQGVVFGDQLTRDEQTITAIEAGITAAAGKLEAAIDQLIGQQTG